MMPSATAVLALLSLIAWLVLMFARGAFWRADQRLDDVPPGGKAIGAGGRWPGVVAVVPARNEAPTIGRAVASLLRQDYPGLFQVVVVDDVSDDGTASAARTAAGALPGGEERLAIVAGRPLPPGWTGKLWAVHQGLAHAETVAADADYVLLTDADIEHDAGNLRRMVGKAESGRLDLVSQMVLLRCQSAWERLLIPAFVFFFQKLYPFGWVNDPARPEAAAAGGCVLVRRDALERTGGIEGIRDRLIDDCALGARIKKGGAIWLGLTERTRSLRAYERLADIWAMVARTAFEQLNRSSVLLAVAAVGMVVVYLVPPVTVCLGLITGDAAAVLAGAAAWLLMGVAYTPTLRLYGQPPWRAVLLPVAALLYTLMTVDSARRHWRGEGGGWKGRIHGVPDRHTG